MSIYVELLKEQEQFNSVLNALKLSVSPIRITGTCETQKVHLAFSICHELSKGMLYIAPDDLTAKYVYDDLCFFSQDNVRLFPATDIIFQKVDAKSNESSSERIKILNETLHNDKLFIVTTIQALAQKTIDVSLFKKSLITIKNGDLIKIEELNSRLVSLGYKREANVEFPGQFSVRGGIIDVFPCNYANPFRIELWDDEIDTIKAFDEDTQLSIENVSQIIIPPAKTDYESVSSTLCDYLQNYLAFYDEPHRIEENYKTVVKDLNDRILNAYENESISLNKKINVNRYLEDYNCILDSIAPNKIIGLSSLSTSSKGLNPKEIFSITSKSTPAYNGNLHLLCEDLVHYSENLYRVIVLCESEGKVEILKRILKECNLPVEYNPKRIPKRGTITLVSGKLKNGFEYPLSTCAVFSVNDFTNLRGKSSVKLRRRSNIRSISDINIGDYVVHYAHGIGIYKGIHQLKVDNVVKDYLKIQYKGADMLYVPVNQLDMVNKYIGAETSVKINKLGGNEWNTAKKKVSASVEILAKDLIRLYAIRENTPGFKFSPDCDYQREFEDTFIYHETEDQISAIADVKRDMEASRPMDRLICGDVGYGKTEIAIRAAFKAVLDSKQVAYLVPTTLLARQHYETFAQRMKDFPVKVEMLSRFKTPKQQIAIIDELKKGHIDIVIGTHKLLQKGIKFKDLGLLIIDEEQRFGVSHKEKIKELKNNVDVLTLTATPIPRTLNMAMTGIRDMSVLNDPPNNRYPVQTYVMEYNDNTVINAIRREVARNGQVYYLYNRVDGIDVLAAKLSKLLPDVRIVYAHGKMSENELENVMLSVLNHEYDVLVCTTIVETGLDIPNMNTIIIEDADKFGLSQLYQLRGRVGRSSRLAYAYLMVKKNKVLDEIAEKRLKAIKEFTEFGSGIKIAMRDLEIRGAGSVLGKKQHGHINQVGYDMYCRLLENAIKSLKENKEIQEELPVTIELSVSCYIPSSYVEDQHTRIEVYKTIASIETPDESYKVIDELIDRFGEPPHSVINLIDSVLIRDYAKKLNIIDIAQKGETILFKLTNETPVKKFISYISDRRVELYLSGADSPVLVYKPEKYNSKLLTKNILKILTEIDSIKGE